MSKNVNAHQVKNSKFRRGKQAASLLCQFAYLVILVTFGGDLSASSRTQPQTGGSINAYRARATKPNGPRSSTDEQHRHDRQLLTASLVWSVAHALTSSYYRSTHDDRPAAVLIKTRHDSSLQIPFKENEPKGI